MNFKSVCETIDGQRERQACRYMHLESERAREIERGGGGGEETN